MSHHTLIGYLHRTTRVMRAVAATLIVTMLSLALEPLAIAANAPAPATTAAPVASVEDQLATTLQAIATQLDLAQTKLATNSDISTEQSALSALREQLSDLDASVQQNFADLATQLHADGLSDTILQRHADTVTAYTQDIATVFSDLDAVLNAGDNATRKAKVGAAKSHLDTENPPPESQPFDPNDLPNKSLEADPHNAPKLKAKDYTQAGLFNTPAVKLAALGPFTFDKLADASDPAYLTATTEITLSDAILAKAEELNHDPVKIYHWVRNNVEWQPTWGAVQNADLTLAAQRGNDMDIASLLIALLRASGIPSRYVHGTIEVLTDKFKNWAGGFANSSSASDFAASGGIPITDIVSGGAVTKHQLEHVWVEAAIDFAPSRGAVNKTADQWVSMDASYKQYDDLPGLDAVPIAGIDPDQLAQDYVASGTVNETEGWVSGFNPTVLRNAQAQTQTALENYITDHLPDATVGDVIGGRRPIIQEAPVLPTGLPYRVVVTGARYSQLPSALQQKMTFAFGSDVLGDLNAPLTLPWAQLNNQKITLSFKPATTADEATLQSLLPAGEITDISQLPTSIPAYLIHVVPELRLNGTVIKTGGSMTLGQDLAFFFNPTFVSKGMLTQQYNVIAGSYLSIAAIAGNVSAQALTDLKTRITATKTTLESNNTALIGALTREDVLGDLFQVGTLGYFAQYLALSHIAGLQQHAHHYLAAGLGSFGYEPKVNTFFGIPRSISAGGVGLNIPIVNVATIDGTDTQARKNFVMQIGVMSSALEHAVPEQMFDDGDPNTPAPDAFSAVKALSKASAAGQRIYHLTAANQNTTLPNIHHDSATMSEIRSALAVGKEVITHTDAVSVPGYTGAGYIIFDPATGAGAYKIAGGLNGGVLKLIDTSLDEILFWVEDVSSSVIDALGGVASRALVNLKETYDHLILIITLLNTCPPAIAMAAFLSMFFVLSGFASLTVAFEGVYPPLGIAVAIEGFYVSAKVGEGFVNRCK